MPVFLNEHLDVSFKFCHGDFNRNYSAVNMNLFSISSEAADVLKVVNF